MNDLRLVGDPDDGTYREFDIACQLAGGDVCTCDTEVNWQCYLCFAENEIWKAMLEGAMPQEATTFDHYLEQTLWSSILDEEYIQGEWQLNLKRLRQIKEWNEIPKEDMSDYPEIPF